MTTNQLDRDAPALFRPTGELDTRAAEGLLAAGLKCLASADEALVIDLDEVTFIDSTGLSALVRIRNAAIADGKVVSVIRTEHSVQRVFELTGLAQAFGISTDRPEAR